MEAIYEEYSDCFEEVESDKVNAAFIKSIRASLKVAKKQPKYYEDFIPIWEDIDKHAKEQEKTKDALKAAVAALTAAVRQKYDALVEADIRELVFTDKWMPSLLCHLQNLMTSAQQDIITNITALNERYDTTLPELQSETDHYRTLVQNYLAEMGITQ